MANYADVLTNAPLPDMIQRFEASDAVASLLAVPPQSSHHAVDIADDGIITQVTPMRDLRHWENGGYFLLRPEIFDELNEGEDLVEDALVRLVRRGEVLAYPYKGYWSPADTVKERAQLDEHVPAGELPVDDLGPRALRWAPTGGRRSAAPALSRRSPRVAPSPPAPRARPSVLAVGAHPDDIEIGAGGTLLGLAGSQPDLQVRYVVLTGTEERRLEAATRRRGVPGRAGFHRRTPRPSRGPIPGSGAT